VLDASTIYSGVSQRFVKVTARRNHHENQSVPERDRRLKEIGGMKTPTK